MSAVFQAMEKKINKKYLFNQDITQLRKYDFRAEEFTSRAASMLNLRRSESVPVTVEPP